MLSVHFYAKKNNDRKILKAITPFMNRFPFCIDFFIQFKKHEYILTYLK